MAGKSAYAQVRVDERNEENAKSTPSTRASPGASDGARQRTGLFDDGWATETICIALGTVLIIVLYIVLRAYDGRPAPRFGSTFGGALTLNTIVAIISASAKATLLLPVAECISQIKWLWFASDYRRLSEVSTFDRASQGILGGLELLWITRFRTFASIGTVLLILGIAIDPLSQQLISSAERSVPSDGPNATVGTLSEWNDGSGQDGMIVIGSFSKASDPTTYSAISTGMKGAILQGLFNANETIPDLSPACSGNCTFEPYASLAVCTSFADVSSSLITKNFTNPNGTIYDYNYDYRYYIAEHQYLREDSYELPFVNVSSAEPPDSDEHSSLQFHDSVAFRDVNAPIADVFMIYQNGTKGPMNAARHNTYAAVEFILEWCVQEYTTSVINGTAITQRKDAYRNFSSPGGSYYTYGKPNGDDGLEYLISPQTRFSLQKYLQTLLSGHIVEPSGGYFYVSSDAIQALAEPYNVWQGGCTQDPCGLSYGIHGTNQTGLELLMNNVATSMTNYMRKQVSGYGSQNNRFVPWANGTVLEQVTVVVIRWKWITAHAVFTALSMIFLAVTVICQRASPLKGSAWKSSSLAALHALDPVLQQELGGVTRQSQLAVQDEKRKVRLEWKSGDGWRLQDRSKEDLELEHIN
ncbi:hypothetical protein LTR56_000447 [Elasticomyces elasticus]|nr:hypothetical protein LTR56_000447 [Elasticomyces elasticus]KAK4922835.1 hypothetical protein LTR49_009842 [Elasticomyces elasticus]KAK5759788.1 hypothetical protein LTS12_010128 [Elasticomyces elasticus]